MMEREGSYLTYVREMTSVNPSCYDLLYVGINERRREKTTNYLRGKFLGKNIYRDPCSTTQSIKEGNNVQLYQLYKRDNVCLNSSDGRGIDWADCHRDGGLMDH